MAVLWAYTLQSSLAARRCVALLQNKLGITDPMRLAQEEERLSKRAALLLYHSG